MTERPEWMPSRESLLSLAHNETLYEDCGHAHAGEELEEMVRSAALRAQIAVLEEMQSHFNSPGGEWFGARRNEKGYVQDKIAALRKELE